MTLPVRRSVWRIYRWPLAIAIASMIGLVSALVGDGWFDAVSWVLLSGTVVLMLWMVCAPAGG